MSSSRNVCQSNLSTHMEPLDTSSLSPCTSWNLYALTCLLACFPACVKESANRFDVEDASYNTLKSLHEPNKNDHGNFGLFSAAPTQSDRCGAQQ